MATLYKNDMHANNGGCKYTGSIPVPFAYSWVQQIRRNLGVSTCLYIVVRTLSPSASGPAIYGPNTLSVIFVIYYTYIIYPLIYFGFKLHFQRYQFVRIETKEYKTRIHFTVEHMKTVYVRNGASFER